MNYLIIKQLRSRKGKVKPLVASAILCGVFLITFTFQNCAEPLVLEGEEFASAADKVPFGYDVNMNLMSYMSCAGNGTTSYNTDAIYSFKVGSYGAVNSGVGLSDAFVATVGKKKLTEQAKILAASKNSRGAQLQVILRRRSNLLQYFTSNDSSLGEEGRDYDNLLAPLDSTDLVNRIVANKGVKTNYFGNVAGTFGRRLEGNLYFNDSEDLANSVRLSLHSHQLLLSLNFADADGDDPTVPFAPADNHRSSIFGRGLLMRFEAGQGMINSSGTQADYAYAGESRVIQQIQEVDLQAPMRDLSSSVANWVCPDELKFMVVRPEDNGTLVFCGGSSTNELQNGFFDTNTQNSDIHYQAARHMLPIEYWHIDFQRRCVVPKTNVDKCYDPAEDRPINYLYNNIGNECGFQTEGKNVGGVNEDAVCPHYVSVCYKAN